MFHRLLVIALTFFVPSLVFAAPASAGKPFNPDLSVNFLGLLRDGSGLSETRTSGKYNGLSLQEAEIQFFSNVDAYLKAVALFSISETAGVFGIDPEEVYVETTTLPLVVVRAGKFKLALGKHNQLHTHAFPFIDPPLFQSNILGDEGLNAAAISASVLAPLPWFSEVTVQGFSLANEALFNNPDPAAIPSAPSSGKTGFLARYRNLWELSDDATAELAFSGMTGKNAFARQTDAFGSDFTLKWRPAEGGKYNAVIWNTEYLQAQRRGRFIAGDSDQRLGGLASYVQFQFAERWWIQARAEVLGIPHEKATPIHTKQSTLIGFFPSEFSGLRLQYDHENDHARPRTDHTVTLQYNVTIGAHPAHAY